VSAFIPLNMAYLGFSHVLPTHALRPYVKSFWLLERSECLATYSEEYMHPGGAFGIVFNLGDPMRVDGVPVLEPIYLHGTNSVSHKMGFAGKVFQIGIKFHIGGAYPILGIPLNLLSNTISLDGVINQGMLNLLYEQLCETDTTRERIARIETWLVQRLEQGKNFSQLVAGSLQTILQSEGNFSMVSFANQLNISQRQLERLYQMHVGMTPKHFARLLRVERAREALKAAQYKSTAEIGAMFDFYDQAHFTNEFKAVVGETPHSYMQRHQKI